VFTALQKREIVERLTAAMVEIEGEGMRRLTLCVVEEIASGGLGHRRHDIDRRRCQGAWPRNRRPLMTAT
jgi:phenylpyruvate tautomerase PptA (4-oxalocrotonate tautomerase family)